MDGRGMGEDGCRRMGDGWRMHGCRRMDGGGCMEEDGGWMDEDKKLQIKNHMYISIHSLCHDTQN